MKFFKRLLLKLILKEIHTMSQTIQDAVTAVGTLKTSVDSLVTETTNANTRLEAKITALQAQQTTMQAQIDALTAQVAAGADTTPIIDALTPIKAAVDNQVASEQVTGV